MRNRPSSIAKPALWRLPMLRALALLLLWPFISFSLIQPGTMPASDGHGRVTMILCGSDAPVEMAVAPDGTVTPLPDQHGSSAPSHDICDWAPHQQALNDPGDAPAIAPSPVVHALARDLGLRGPHPSAAALSPSARGPPAFL
ncbi:MAG TPA: hypothetical protein VNQ78_15545 [Paracoccus sp. (in: a-proteobacteria)]|uniref:hypothetical protein n=1 Tax=Paracoccus sp. TaxID=267 RepID=UPI002CD1D5E5|nr:hypothetical protein [Paracoccus sp. (in: a-proteobacteria)]HWL58076.1 hypothetical protein [Paracoccus sp. (in: a-proteobacteria)]